MLQTYNIILKSRAFYIKKVKRRNNLTRFYRFRNFKLKFYSFLSLNVNKIDK